MVGTASPSAEDLTADARADGLVLEPFDPDTLAERLASVIATRPV